MRLAREGFASLGFVGSAIDEELVGEVARRGLAIYGEKWRFGVRLVGIRATVWPIVIALSGNDLTDFGPRCHGTQGRC